MLLPLHPRNAPPRFDPCPIRPCPFYFLPKKQKLTLLLRQAMAGTYRSRSSPTRFGSGGFGVGAPRLGAVQPSRIRSAHGRRRRGSGGEGQLGWEGGQLR
jgi:hypothetical protein